MMMTTTAMTWRTMTVRASSPLTTPVDQRRRVEWTESFCVRLSCFRPTAPSWSEGCIQGPTGQGAAGQGGTRQAPCTLTYVQAQSGDRWSFSAATLRC